MRILAQILATGGFILLMIAMVYYSGNGLLPQSKEEFLAELIPISMIAVGYFLNKRYEKKKISSKKTRLYQQSGKGVFGYIAFKK